MIKSIMNYFAGKVVDSDPYNPVTVDSEGQLKQVSMAIAGLNKSVNYKPKSTISEAKPDKGMDFIKKLSHGLNSSSLSLEENFNFMINKDLNLFPDEENRPLSTKALKRRTKYKNGWE